MFFKKIENATSCVREQDATTAPARHGEDAATIYQII